MSTHRPDQLPSVTVLTFDNLGEASELERGVWPTEEPLGRHPSVSVVLPRLLDELDRHRLTATFFVEAINCELYPDALHEIAGRGHELGNHGWRHEPWGELSAEQERDAISRGMRAFGELGLRVRGFRPPGGDLTASSARLLRDVGITWCSPAAGDTGVRDGLVYVPFEWQLVDAYHLMERFRGLRVRRGDAAEAMKPGALADRLIAELDAGASGERTPGQRTSGHHTLILHPFLMLDEAWFAGVRRLLGAIAELTENGRTSVLPGGQFAELLASA